MASWLIWIVIACALAAGEAATLGFYLAPFAFGAVLAAGAAAAGAASAVQGSVFVVVAGLSFLLVRPIARSHRDQPGSLRTGAGALIGRRVLVVERIANDEGLGCVRIDGEVWTARACDQHAEFRAGSKVSVKEIRGATAMVAE